jgi:DsbC/DsbD-like thiol-disulfide interchange protein
MSLILTLLLVLAPSAQRPSDVVRWTAAPVAKPAAPGTTVRVQLDAAIEDTWKLYALSQPKGGPVPLAINLEKGSALTLNQKEISGPLPKVMKDDNFKLETQYYEHQASFVVPVTLPKNASGKVQVPLDVTFQACGANICLRPFTPRVTVEVTVNR